MEENVNRAVNENMVGDYIGQILASRYLLPAPRKVEVSAVFLDTTGPALHYFFSEQYFRAF
ncbi:MAG: hypothetical protein ACYC9L_01905 [Sulfuricaulis sp.]